MIPAPEKPAPDAAQTAQDVPQWIRDAARECDNLCCNAVLWEARVAAIIANAYARHHPADAGRGLLETLAVTAYSLRSAMGAVETIDADERYAAREERRSAHVHTSLLKQSADALAKANELLPKDKQA